MAGRVAAVRAIQNIVRSAECRSAMLAHGRHVAAAALRGVEQKDRLEQRIVWASKQGLPRPPTAIIFAPPPLRRVKNESADD